MRRLMTAAVTVMLVAACGGNDDGGGDAQAEPERPEWTRFYEAELVPAPEEDVWLDEARRTVYVQDCDRRDELTSQGGPYGPGDGEPGWAGVCEG